MSRTVDNSDKPGAIPGKPWAYDIRSTFMLREACVIAHTEGLWSNAISPIVLSAAAVEAYVTDALAALTVIDPSLLNERQSELKSTLADLENKRARFQDCLSSYWRLVTGEDVPEEESPFRELGVLREIRNDIVHHKCDVFNPYRPEAQGRLLGCYEQLKDWGVLDGAPDPSNPLIGQVVTTPVARWSCVVARDCIIKMNLPLSSVGLLAVFAHLIESMIEKLPR